MWGAFRCSPIAMGGLVWKIPWKLNATRKANMRAREKNVRQVEEILKSTVDIKAFHKEDPYVPSDIDSNPRSRYFIEVLKGKKSVHKIPHFTKNFKSRHGYYELPPQRPPRQENNKKV
jgi:hypothetical protein